MTGTAARPRRVLAIASAGGHWVQLRRLAPAFAGCAVTWVATDPGLAPGIAAEGATFRAVPDANRWQKRRLILQALAVGWLVLRLRPQAIVTTGASAGYFALLAGRLVGARRVWIDSIANAAELSLSGQRAGRHAHLWLTQWPDLARRGPDGRGPDFRGAVL